MIRRVAAALAVLTAGAVSAVAMQTPAMAAGTWCDRDQPFRAGGYWLACEGTQASLGAPTVIYTDAIRSGDFRATFDVYDMTWQHSLGRITLPPGQTLGPL